MLSSISTKPPSGPRSGALARRVAHRRHLHAQQLAGRRAGDELRRRAGRAAPQALLDALERVRDELAVEDGVDRAAEADQLGAAGQRRRARQRPELRPGRGCCRAGCGRRGCTPRRSASARTSAPRGGCAPARCRGWPRCTCASMSCAQLRALAQRAALTVAGQRPVARRCPAAASSRTAVAGEQRLRALGQAGRGRRRSRRYRRRARQRRRAPNASAARPSRRTIATRSPAPRASTRALGGLERGRSSAATPRQRQRAPARRRAPAIAAARRALGLQAAALQHLAHLLRQLPGRERLGHVGVGAERRGPWRHRSSRPLAVSIRIFVPRDRRRRRAPPGRPRSRTCVGIITSSSTRSGRSLQDRRRAPPGRRARR